MSKRGIADLADVMEGAADRMVELRERAEKAEEALGEAEKRAFESAHRGADHRVASATYWREEAESVAVRRYEEVQALEEKLESLRSGLKAELVMVRAEAGEYRRRAIRFKEGFDHSEARRFDSLADDKKNSADRLQQLLDVSEDTTEKLKLSGEGEL